MATKPGGLSGPTTLSGLPMNAELATRLEMAEVLSYESRLGAVQRLSENPMGIELRRFGEAAARLVRDNPAVSCVQGLTARSRDELDDIETWFRARDQHVRLTVSPFLSSSELLKVLAARGYSVTGFDSVLYGVPVGGASPPLESVEVRELPRGTVEIVADVVAEDAPWNTSQVREDLRALYRRVSVAQFLGPDRAAWHLYLASVDGAPAAVAALHVRDGIGTLTFDGTIGRFRSRGCQTALIHRRIADAAASGCALVVTQTTPGTTSQRNMERAGLRTAYTRTFWTPTGGEGRR